MNISTAEMKARRAAYLAEHHFTPDMTPAEAFKLNEEILRLFPLTPEEDAERRAQKIITVPFEFK
jgi:hypothetical protein